MRPLRHVEMPGANYVHIDGSLQTRRLDISGGDYVLEPSGKYETKKKNCCKDIIACLIYNAKQTRTK